jgi:hypothetical protein
MQMNFKNIAPNFRIEEFVPQIVFEKWGERSIWFVDPSVIIIAQFIRRRFNKPVTLNNWHANGLLQNRGFRTAETHVGAAMSQHRFGRAADVSVTGINPHDLADDIRTNFAEYNAIGLTTIEDPNHTPTWLHYDVRWTGLSKLLTVKP